MLPTHVARYRALYRARWVGTIRLGLGRDIKLNRRNSESCLDPALLLWRLTDDRDEGEIGGGNGGDRWALVSLFDFVVVVGVTPEHKKGSPHQNRLTAQQASKRHCRLDEAHVLLIWPVWFVQGLDLFPDGIWVNFRQSLWKWHTCIVRQWLASLPQAAR